MEYKWCWDRRDEAHTLEGGHVQMSKEWSQGTNEVLAIGLYMVGEFSGVYIYERCILDASRLDSSNPFFLNQEIIEELFFFSFFYGDHLVFLLSFFLTTWYFFLSLFLFASSKIYFYFWNMTALHPHSWMILALEYKQQLNKRIEVFETKYLPLFLSLFLIL